MIDIPKEVLAYQSYLRLSNFQRSTVVMYSRTLKIFLEYVLENFPGAELSQDHAQHYLLMRLDRNKAWSTINADYSALRKYYKVMKDYPWSLKKLPRPKRDKRLPVGQELSKLTILTKYIFFKIKNKVLLNNLCYGKGFLPQRLRKRSS